MNKLLMFVGGLAIWYTMTGAPRNYTPQNYSLPQKIQVLEAHYEEKDGDKVSIEDGVLTVNDIKVAPLEERVINPEEINFDKDFEVRTDKYRLVKSDDWLPSRICGHVMSTLSKVYFWDHNMSWGLDGKKSRAVLAMLESNEKLKDLTVRINHNEAIYDAYRLFGDKKVVKRNNVIARATLGLISCLCDELWAELFRGDYYNPMTQTVVTYSNIECIPAHELGHHQDYQRFTSDWEYSLLGIIPPVKLYKEWQASSYAKDMLAEQDKFQFERYLLPAFLTYILGFLSLFKKKKKKDGPYFRKGKRTKVFS